MPDGTANVTEGMKERLLNDLERNISHAKEIGDDATVKLLTEAKVNLKIVEQGTVTDAAAAKDRILTKIADGKANTGVTANEALSSAAQGAVIGAAIALTISGITNFIRYRNGELTSQEAFTNIGEDTVKSAIMGGAMGTLTLFMPAGAVGIVAGFAIGMYMNATLTNILDEVFGKGAYLEILTAGGYVMGTSMNLSAAMKEFAEGRKVVGEAFEQIEEARIQSALEREKFNRIMEVLE